MMNRSDLREVGSKYRVTKYYKLGGLPQGEIVELFRDDGSDRPRFLTKSDQKFWIPIEMLEPVPALEDIKVGQRVEIVGNHCEEDPHFLTLGGVGTVNLLERPPYRVKEGQRIFVAHSGSPSYWVLPEDIRIIEDTKPCPEDIKVGQKVEVYGHTFIKDKATVLAINDDGSIKVKFTDGYVQDLRNHLKGQRFSITAILEESPKVNSYGVRWDDLKPGTKILDADGDIGYIRVILEEEHIIVGYWPTLKEKFYISFARIKEILLVKPMKMEDIKVGQQVVVIGDSSNHKFDYGTVIEVESILINNIVNMKIGFFSVDIDGHIWAVKAEDVELLEEAPESQEEEPTPKVVKILRNTQPHHFLIIDSLAEVQKVYTNDAGKKRFKVLGTNVTDSRLVYQIVSPEDVEVIV